MFDRDLRNRRERRPRVRAGVPAFAGLRPDHTEKFLLNHIRSVNLQRPGSTNLRANDLRLKSNEEFWEKLLRRPRLSGIRWVELRGFRMIDWFPRAPGLYHTDEAAEARREAQHYVREEDGVVFYEPRGKRHMIEGGIGSVRFKPVTIGNEDHWLSTATSDIYCHTGIPLAIPSSLMERLDSLDSMSNFRHRITGEIKFLPDFLEEHFYHLTRIRQVYVLVDNIEILKRDKGPAVEITPMVFFTGGHRAGLRENENVTYVRCHADSLDILDRAAEWLEWYTRRYHGEIITNFDQQRPTFRDVPFSLDNVMNGRLEKYQLRRFHIDNAEIICDTIESIRAEAMTMSKIEVKLGDGTTIHGDFVVAHSIKDSFNKAASADISDELKELLKALTREVGKMSETLPKETAEQVARDLQTLVAEASSKTPRRQWWQLSAEGLKQAARNVSEIGKPVLELVAKIVPLLSAVSS